MCLLASPEGLKDCIHFVFPSFWRFMLFHLYDCLFFEISALQGTVFWRYSLHLVCGSMMNSTFAREPKQSVPLPALLFCFPSLSYHLNIPHQSKPTDLFLKSCCPASHLLICIYKLDDSIPSGEASTFSSSVSYSWWLSRSLQSFQISVIEEIQSSSSANFMYNQLQCPDHW